MTYATTIAIDGPAASGKSTLGARLAKQLNYTFVDAGTLYRAITHEALARLLDIDDEAAMGRLARNIRLDINMHGINLHSEAVNRAVAVVAAHPEVRASVRRIQRDIAQNGRVVFAGRDIGTVVLPNADLKFFLQVSLKERVERRYSALVKTSPHITREQVWDDLLRRDELDSTRAVSPMRPADDAILIHTDGLSIDAALAVLLRYAQTPREKV